MINTLLVIFFSLSSTAASGLTDTPLVTPAVRVEIACAGDQVVSDGEAQALYQLMDQNRQRIFDRIGEKAEQAITADLDPVFAGEEPTLLSAAE